LSSTITTGLNPNYLKAGQVIRGVRKDVESRDWRGKPYLELCNYVESAIRAKGAEPAFPCNLCADEVAAHYTAEINDERMVPQETILKVDLGAHVDGYVADSAVTLCYRDELYDLVDATRSALMEALKVIKSGGRTTEVGRVVEVYASRRGYVPISNLSGHSLDQYIVHSGTTVPNVWSPSPAVFREDRAYAIEPFFTTSGGSGVVVEGKSENIFGLVSRKKIKDSKLNNLLEAIWTKRKTLPFAARWFVEDFGKGDVNAALKELVKLRVIRSYPELIEARGTPVAQAEHTIATTASGYLILT